MKEFSDLDPGLYVARGDNLRELFFLYPSVKEYSNIPVVCGGTHATTCPEEVISDKNFDIVCVVVKSV